MSEAMDEEDGLLLSQDYIRKKLRSIGDVFEWVDQVQDERKPKLAICEPALGMLDALGYSKLNLYQNLAEHLKEELFKELIHAPKTNVAKLVMETLPLLDLKDFEDVPIRVLGALPDPPQYILEQLSELDHATVEKLPRHIRQRVWEQFPETFSKHTRELMDQYVHDHTSITWNEEMHPGDTFPLPYKRRQKCAPLQDMVRAVGSSARLYRYLVDDIRTQFAETNNVRYCSLRYDLLMALHDVTATNVLATEPCHDFVWHLDAYVKEIFSNMARDEMTMKVASLQRTVIEKMSKIEIGEFKTLVSAFDPSVRTIGTDNSGGGFGSGSRGRGGRGRGRGGRGGGRSTAPGSSSMSATSSSSNSKAALQRKDWDLNSVLYEVWKKVKAADKHHQFLSPVVETYPMLAQRYLAIVKHPMDLTTISNKIAKKQYSSLDEMRRDLHLIADNATLFNGPANKISINATKIMKQKAESYLNWGAQRLEQSSNSGVNIGNGSTTSATGSGNQTTSTNNGKITIKKESKSQSPEELEKERARMQLICKDRLVEMEKRTRHARAISDAAMILASSCCVNALTNVLWFVLGEEVIPSQILPRDATITSNIAWLLQIAESAHTLVLKARSGQTITLDRNSAHIEKECLPVCTSMLLDSAQFRSENMDREMDPIEPELGRWCKESWFTRNAVLNFFCSRVSHRDRSIVEPLLKIFIDELRSLAADHPSFLHSFITSIYMSSLNPATRNPATIAQQFPKSAWKKRKALEQLKKRPPILPPLPATFLTMAINDLFLNDVLETTEKYIETDPIRTARKHLHLIRLLTLDVSTQSLMVQELESVCKASILSLSGRPRVEHDQVLKDLPLRDLVNKRFSADTFEKPRRLYEKLFRKFPQIRVVAGLPPLMESSGQGVTPSPSPSPFVTPSPSPFNAAPSPFVAGGDPFAEEEETTKKRKLNGDDDDEEGAADDDDNNNNMEMDQDQSFSNQVNEVAEDNALVESVPAPNF